MCERATSYGPYYFRASEYVGTQPLTEDYSYKGENVRIFYCSLV